MSPLSYCILRQDLKLGRRCGAAAWRHQIWPKLKIGLPQSTLCSLQSTFYILHLTLHTSHFTMRTSHFRLHIVYASRFARHAPPHSTLHTPYFTLHTLYSPKTTLQLALHIPLSFATMRFFWSFVSASGSLSYVWAFGFVGCILLWVEPANLKWPVGDPCVDHMWI